MTSEIPSSESENTVTGRTSDKLTAAATACSTHLPTHPTPIEVLRIIRKSISQRL